jgi:hypothetical protein
MASAFSDTAALLRELALRNPVALVMFSGGKDSLVLADIASRAFRKIVLVHFYFVPGLSVIEEALDYAKTRWKADAYQAPSARISGYLKQGVCCFPLPSVAVITPPEALEAVRQELGVRLAVNGAKRTDSYIMRRKIKAAADPDLHFPLRAWNKADVLAYLGEAGIPIPTTPDIGLGPYSVCWLHDNKPDDFRKLAAIFPFAEAFVRRRNWYGTEYKHKVR